MIANKLDLLILSENWTNVNYWEKHFLQIADIYFYDSDFQEGGNFYNDGKGWFPIGESNVDPFTGSYDGGGFTITSLYINRGDNNYTGFFGVIDDAELSNIGLVNVAITGGDQKTGALVGEAGDGSTITNSFVSGTLTANNLVGGFVGENSGLIQNSYANVVVSGNINVGGFVGRIWSSGSIESCFALGDVSGTNYVGGFVGYSINDIENSYSRGNVTRSSGSSTMLGGFIGRSWESKIINSYSTGSVTFGGTIQTDKGFAGEVDTGGDYEMTGNFWDTETTDANSTEGDATGKDLDEMKTESTFTDADWDFADIWAIDSEINDGYPYLQMKGDVPNYLVTFTEENAFQNITLTVYSDEEMNNEVGTATNNSDGTYEIDLEDGNYWFKAELPGYDDYEGDFEVDGEAKNVDFTMTEEVLVPTGTITDPEAAICVGSSYTVPVGTATATHYSAVLWSHNGEGTLDHADTFTPTYNSVAGDAGNDVILTMEVTGTGEFSTVTVTASNQVTITVDPLPSGNIESLSVICVGTSYTVNAGTATATHYSAVSWSHNGEGTLDDDNTFTPTYNFVAGDAGNDVILTMAVTGAGTCDTVTVTATGQITLTVEVRVRNITKGKNYIHIQDAVDAADPSDVIEVAAGTYNEQVTINEALTIKGPFYDAYGHDASRDGETGEAIIEFQPTPPGDDAAIVVIKADNVVFKGFTVRDGGTFIDDDMAGIVGIVVLGASNCVVENNIAYGNAIGIAIMATNEEFSGNIIRGNYLYDNVYKNEAGEIVTGDRGVKAGRGIMIDRFVGNELVTGTIIESNHVTGSAYGIYLYAANGTVIGRVIENENKGNFLYNNYHHGIRLFGSSDNLETETTIQYNKIYNNGLVGFTGIFDKPDADVYEKMYAKQSAGIQIYGAENTVVNNEIYNEAETGGLQNRGVCLNNRWSSSGNAWVKSEDNSINENMIFGHNEQVENVTLDDQFGVGITYGDGPDSYNADATKNWWGDASGPYHDPHNTCGEGNKVSQNVEIYPWYSDEAMTTEAGLPVYNDDQDTFYCTIQDAIENVDPGETVIILSGTYSETVTLKNGVVLSPGASPGCVTVNNLNAEATGGTLLIDLWGDTKCEDPNGYDSWHVTNTVNLEHISLALDLKYVPACDNVFEIITSGNPIENEFNQGNTIMTAYNGVTYTFTIDYSNNKVTLTPAKPTATAGGDATICANGLHQVCGASAEHYSSVLWEHNGQGNLTNPETLTPTYTAHANDAGKTVTLTMTVTGIGVYGTATDVYTIHVESFAQAGSLTKHPNDDSVEMGATVSATLTEGSGGNGTDELHYRTHDGTSWSEWENYTSGNDISSFLKTAIQIRTWREADYCPPAGIVTVSWDIEQTSVVNVNEGFVYYFVQHAIDAASEGDTIRIGTNIYPENINTTGKGGLTLQPGFSHGIVTVTGTFTLSADDVLEMGLFGDDDYDKFIIEDNAFINGATLDIKVVGPYKPEAGKKFTIFTSPNNPGTFSNPQLISANGHYFILSYEDNAKNGGYSVVLTAVKQLFKMEIRSVGSDQ